MTTTLKRSGVTLYAGVQRSIRVNIVDGSDPARAIADAVFRVLSGPEDDLCEIVIAPGYARLTIETRRGETESQITARLAMLAELFGLHRAAHEES